MISFLAGAFVMWLLHRIPQEVWAELYAWVKAKTAPKEKASK